jgi:prevent-host-death family protein
VLVEELPQRDLRNRIGEVLRAAEAGARYVVTVAGRPVAELGPHTARRWVGSDEIRALLATPTDEDVLADLRGQDIDAGLDGDVWPA